MTAADRPEVDDPRVLALAKARQQMAHDNPFNAGFCPPWNELSEQEQRLSLLDARNYLRAALKAGLFASSAVSVVPPATNQTALLSDAERQFLTFALDLAADEMASRGDEFGDDDEAALETLRRLAAEAPHAETPDAHSCGNCEGIDPDSCLTNLDRPAVKAQQGAAKTPDEAPGQWCKCPSCWGWFVEDHPGEDLDELGGDLSWWSGLPEHRDAPAVVAQPGKETDRG